MSVIAIEAIPASWIRDHYWIQFCSRNDKNFRLFLPIKRTVRLDYYYVFEPADTETFAPVKVQPHDILSYQQLFPIAKRTREIHSD